jgi:hypothetical protein
MTPIVVEFINMLKFTYTEHRLFQIIINVEINSIGNFIMVHSKDLKRPCKSMVHSYIKMV